jgi:intracellular sulfur oxidation DsrE/DsrF family protein
MERDDALDSGRRALLLAGVAAAVAGAAVPAYAQTAVSSLKIVLHVSEGDAWPRALSNVRNLTEKYPAVKVKVVVDGDGVYGYQGSNEIVSAMAAFAKNGVQFEACHNALDEKRIPVASIAPFVKVVPAAVIAIAEAQREGYAYIKP